MKQKNIFLIFLVFFLLLACKTLSGSGRQTLPDEAKAAIDKAILEWGGEVPEYNIVYSARGNDWTDGRELWCVKFDRPIDWYFGPPDEHALLLHTGNLWEMYAVSSEDIWLARGCTDW